MYSFPCSPAPGEHSYDASNASDTAAAKRQNAFPRL